MPARRRLKLTIEPAAPLQLPEALQYCSVTVARTTHQRMQKLREKVKPARDKLAAHADRDAVRKGEPLGEASFQEWDDL